MARIKRLLPLLVVVLLAVIVFALFQLGVWPFGGASDDTANLTSTTQVAGTHTGQGKTTTTAGKGASTTTTVSDAQQYLAAMNDWYATYWAKADAKALTFKKPLAPTAKEIARAKDFVTAMHASVAAIKGITAPEEVAQAHALYCSSLAAEVRELDRLVRAIQTKNKRDIELGMRYTTEARKCELAAMSTLSPYLTAAGNTASTTAGQTASKQ